MTRSNLDYAFPEGLDPRLRGLAWMLGHWEGHGQTQWPGAQDQKVLEQVDFDHTGEGYLHYLLQVFADDDGRPGRTVVMESGFWIPGEKDQVMAVIANSEGAAQTWHGTITGLRSTPGGELATRIQMNTDAALSQGTHTAGTRLWGKINDTMMFAYDRADQDVPLQPWLTGELTRR